MNPRGNTQLLFMLLAFGALLGGTGLNYWQFNNSAKVQARVEKLEKEVGSESDLQQKVDDSKLALEEGIQELMHLEANLTTIEYVPTLLKDLQHSGESCSLKITGVRPMPRIEPKTPSKPGEEAPKKVRKAYEELDIEVKCNGSFSNVMTFLEKLETFPKIVGVRYVSVKPQSTSDGYSLESIVASLSIRIYVFPAEQPGLKTASRTPGEVTNG